MAAAALAACDPPGQAAEPTPQPPPPATPTPEPVDEPREGGTLRMGIAEPASIVPLDAVEPHELLVVDALFDSLTRYGVLYLPEPAAATSWRHNSDATEWTFTLREGATFHDGAPVTADDFVFGWTAAVREGAAGFHLRDVVGYDELVAGQTDVLRGVTAADPLTLQVRLRRPRGDFASIVAHPALGPMSSDHWRADPQGYREEPVGNGPFVAAEAVVPGQYIRLQRFAGWRNGREPVAIDEVLMQIMDPDTAFVAFQQGRLQVSPLPEGAMELAVEQYGASPDGLTGPGVLDGPTPTVYFFAFDVTQEPYDDPDVRRAISLAIDRQAIVDGAGQATAEVADAFLHPLLGGRSGACDACRHDPEEAAALLEDHDLDRLTLWFNREGGHLLVAQQIKEDLEAVGVPEVRFQSPPFPEYMEALREGGAGFFRFGWRPEHLLSTDPLDALFHSDGEHNHMRYEREDVDELIDAARAATTSGFRGYYARQAEDRVLNRDQVVVPIMWFRHHLVVASEVEGFRLDPLGQANLHEVRLTR